MSVTDELLLALADGELDTETAERVRKAIAADPQLQADYAVFEESARLLRETLDPGPTPARLIEAINAAPTGSIGTAAAADRVVVPFARRSAPAAQPFFWGAIAASLVLGVVIGSYGLRPTVTATEQTALAYATLPTGEEEQLADGTTVRALGSYQTDEGPCRDILVVDASQQRHDLICKAGGDWQVALSLSAPAQTGYLPANDALTAGLDGYLNALGAGGALDPIEEKAILATP